MNRNIAVAIACGAALGCGSSALSPTDGGSDLHVLEISSSDRTDQSVEQGPAEASTEGGGKIADAGDGRDGNAVESSHGCTPGLGSQECGPADARWSCTPQHACCPGFGSDCVFHVLGIGPAVDAGLAPCASDDMCPAGEYCEDHARCCPVGYICSSGNTSPRDGSADTFLDASSDADLGCAHLGCTPSATHSFCNASEVQWECQGSGWSPLFSACRDPATNLQRFCCAPSFLSMCL